MTSNNNPYYYIYTDNNIRINLMAHSTQWFIVHISLFVSKLLYNKQEPNNAFPHCWARF